MSGIKKDPGQCCNTNRGMSIEEAATALEALFEHTITEADRQPGEIEKLLRRGEVNAIRTADLVKLAGCSNNRVLRAKIEQERLDGALILSTVRNGGGYFLPSEGLVGQYEIESYVSTLTARAVSIFRTLSAARKALKRIEGQTSLSDLLSDIDL